MTTAMYAVEGMMCDSCMDAVLENVHSLSGVTVVAMDLVTGGQSPLLVTSGTKLGADAVRDAVRQVGFGVRPPKVQERRDRVSSPPTQDGVIHEAPAPTTIPSEV
jgi:copper chaperone